jgi:CTP:molybdopterin cytidylyltransferase MocA
MPQVPVSLIEAELEIHRCEPVEIIVPRIKGQRTNPVLFDRSTFGKLVALTGDMGGRALFDHHPLRWLDLEYLPAQQDIDTPADYQQLMDEDKNG